MTESEFVPPRNFAEFYDRDPLCIRKFAARTLRKYHTHSDVRDLEQDLLLHLATLPENSTFRDDGFTDRIATWDASRCGGHNTAHIWYAWLFGLCRHYYISWISRRKQDVLTNSKYTLLSDNKWFERPHYIDLVGRSYIAQFRDAVAEEKPRLLPFLMALIDHDGNITDAGASLGYTTSQTHSATYGLRTAAKRFVGGLSLRRKNGRQPSVKLVKYAG